MLSRQKTKRLCASSPGLEDNRRKVDQFTGGRVAYVWLTHPGSGGFTSFNRNYFAQIGKDAAIIDERYGGGGRVGDYFASF
jgi:tricorn protease